MSNPEINTIFELSLADPLHDDKYITTELAETIFNFFKSCPIFRWSDVNNDCEDRANAICILLDEWNIPNYKGWVFSGYFLKKKNGSLTNFWNYHVAALLPVKEDNRIIHYIIDPATSGQLITIADWALNITAYPFSYYTIKSGDTYIFSSRHIDKDNWYKRNKRNYRWTMQGLSGINGVSVIGKAKLRFTKERVRKTEYLFKKLRYSKPSFLTTD